MFDSSAHQVALHPETADTEIPVHSRQFYLECVPDFVRRSASDVVCFFDDENINGLRLHQPRKPMHIGSETTHYTLPELHF